KDGPYPAYPPLIRYPSTENVKYPRVARCPSHSRRTIDRGQASIPGGFGGGTPPRSGERGWEIAGRTGRYPSGGLYLGNERSDHPGCESGGGDCSRSGREAEAGGGIVAQGWPEKTDPTSSGL